MRHFIQLGVLFGAVLFGSAVQAAGKVSVTFKEPARFRDVHDERLKSESNLAALRRHIEEAAAPRVADGQTLRVEVTDVDLAGEIRPGGTAAQPVRVMSGGSDWPRVELRYVLEEPGKAPVSGRATVQDMSYLQRASGLRAGIDLPHERRMLEEWFRTSFPRPAPN
jgi:Protein of unknown function (DUF3016)